jgi:menaquinone-dependent protoporphyrinogen oxidase
MSKNVLVTYATRAGSTFEVASVIGEVLAARGFSIEVRPVKENPIVKEYQAVVMGSAIRMGNWLPEAMDFIIRNQSALNQVPTVIFTVHMLNTGGDAASRATRQAYTIPVRELLAPLDEAFFTGKIDYANLSFFDRTIAKAAEKSTGTVASDFRDWGKIRAWAQTILA